MFFPLISIFFCNWFNKMHTLLKCPLLYRTKTVSQWQTIMIFVTHSTNLTWVILELQCQWAILTMNSCSWLLHIFRFYWRLLGYGRIMKQGKMSAISSSGSLCAYVLLPLRNCVLRFPHHDLFPPLSFKDFLYHSLSFRPIIVDLPWGLAKILFRANTKVFLYLILLNLWFKITLFSQIIKTLNSNTEL